MMDHDDGIDARLERLRVATGSVRARAGFADRVVAAIDRETRSFDGTRALFRAARALVPVAAIAAAIGVVYAIESQHAWDDALSTYSAVEGEW